MDMDYWQKQTAQSPLFDDILWSRPETKHGAGKLLIVGGNAHGFAAAQGAYAAADAAGAGHIRLVLPDALKSSLGVLGPYDYAPSTSAGSFARDALNELLTGAAWADAVTLAGDLGRSSETAVLLENFVQKYDDPLILTKDAVDYFYAQPETLAMRPNTVAVLSLPQLQRLATALKFEMPFLTSMGMLLLVQALHAFTEKFSVVVMTKEQDNIVVASKGRVSSTKLQLEQDHWQVAIAARASVFWMQNKDRPYEAVTTSLVV